MNESNDTLFHNYFLFFSLKKGEPPLTFFIKKLDRPIKGVYANVKPK